MASIKLENVYKNFGKTSALKNLNIEIFNGEFFVLLGPTGAGKTTTLRIISGLEQPDRGNIFFDEEFMNDVQPAFRDTSYVFQQFSLYPHYSVYDNLAFPLRSPLRKESKLIIDKKEIATVNSKKIESLNLEIEDVKSKQSSSLEVNEALLKNEIKFLKNDLSSKTDILDKFTDNLNLSLIHI